MASNQVHELLDRHEIHYEVHDHPRVIEASRLAEAEDVTGWDVAKPVLLSIGGQLAMMVVPAPVQVDLDRAGDVLGHARARLATEDEFASQFPDCEPGAEPPFGNLYGVPVFLDETLRARKQMVCRDGSHTRAITLDVADYVRVVVPEVVDVAVPPG